MRHDDQVPRSHTSGELWVGGLGPSEEGPTRLELGPLFLTPARTGLCDAVARPYHQRLCPANAPWRRLVVEVMPVVLFVAIFGMIVKAVVDEQREGPRPKKRTTKTKANRRTKATRARKGKVRRRRG